MKKIRVERQNGYYGIIRSLKIIVDGISIGSIKEGKTVIFEVPENSQEIWGKMDWGVTHRLNLCDYDLDKTIVFKAYLSIKILENLAIMKMPFKVFLR